MPKFSDKLLIAANIPDYPDDLDQFAEIWGINTSYGRFPDRRVHRLYYFDNHTLIDPDFVEKVNARPDMRVITKWPDPLIPTSESFPLDDMIRVFGYAYWTCSVAYTIAHALYDGWKHITLAGMYHVEDSWEYAHHKPCVEHWIGRALGMGVSVEIHGQSMLLKPHGWESEVYGYEVNDFRRLFIDTIAGAFTGCNMYPLKFLRAKAPHPEFQPEYLSHAQRQEASLPVMEVTPV